MCFRAKLTGCAPGKLVWLRPSRFATSFRIPYRSCPSALMPGSAIEAIGPSSMAGWGKVLCFVPMGSRARGGEGRFRLLWTASYIGTCRERFDKLYAMLRAMGVAARRCVGLGCRRWDVTRVSRRGGALSIAHARNCRPPEEMPTTLCCNAFTFDNFYVEYFCTNLSQSYDFIFEQRPCIY